jgi:hypothetical protein
MVHLFLPSHAPRSGRPSLAAAQLIKFADLSIYLQGK